jgi:hypothetical protein
MPLLFSYGTLRQDTVQLSTFGRLLRGEPDELLGFEQIVTEVTDPDFTPTNGKSELTIVTFNGRSSSRVRGTVFDVSDTDLASADAYEPDGYTRVLAALASGRRAWVYARA